MKGLMRGLLGPMLLGLSLPGEWLFVAAVTLLLLTLTGTDRTNLQRQGILMALGAGLVLMAGQWTPGGFRDLLNLLGWYSVALMVSWTLGDRTLRRLTHDHLKVREGYEKEKQGADQHVRPGARHSA